MSCTRTLPRILFALVAACSTGCPSDPVSPPGEGDGGAALDGALQISDAGTSKQIPWPEPTMIVEGAMDPSFAQAPDGRLMLAYLRGDKAWIQNDPPTGTPAELGPGYVSGHSELQLVASPTSDRAFAVWSDNRGVFLTAGVPDGPSSYLYNGFGGLFAFAPAWVGDRPYLVVRKGEYSIGSDHYPPLQLGFHVPLDTPGALPMPEISQAEALRVLGTGFHHYNEAERVLDLGQGRAFTFLTSWEQGETGPADTHYARWWVLQRAPSGRWLSVLRTGQLELPQTGVAWIQPHALGGGRYALTWAGATNSLVYDVFVAGLALAEDGTPSLTTAGVNVSMTFGETDNSDHPVLASAGDGRTWLAWRESRYGPRVALLGPDMRVVALGAPAVDLECSGSSSIAGVAGADGTFHLAAGVVPGGTLSLRYWRFPRP